MNCVIENIEYLIHRNDYVIVPSWGAFISTRQSARYDEETSQFIPPCRTVSFNPEVDYNNGSLAQSIARRNGITVERAGKIIEDEVRCMRRQLDLDGEISFGAVGRFIRQEQGTPIFEPSEMLLRDESYSLPTVEVTPVVKIAKAEAEAEQEAEQTRKPSPVFRLIKVAASLAVAVTVGAMLLIPMFSGRNDNLAGVTTPTLTIRPSQTSAIPSSEGLVLSIALPSKTEVKNDVAPVEETVTSLQETAPQEAPIVSVSPAAPQETPKVSDNPAAPRLERTDRYCLVVASLPSATLAEKYIAEQKGESLSYFESDGKYRVYAATGTSGSELAKTHPSLAKVFDSHPDAWVCRMK